MSLPPPLTTTTTTTTTAANTTTTDPSSRSMRSRSRLQRRRRRLQVAEWTWMACFALGIIMCWTQRHRIIIMKDAASSSFSHNNNNNKASWILRTTTLKDDNHDASSSATTTTTTTTTTIPPKNYSTTHAPPSLLHLLASTTSSTVNDTIKDNQEKTATTTTTNDNNDDKSGSAERHHWNFCRATTNNKNKNNNLPIPTDATCATRNKAAYERFQNALHQYLKGSEYSNAAADDAYQSWTQQLPSRGNETNDAFLSWYFAYSASATTTTTTTTSDTQLSNELQRQQQQRRRRRRWLVVGTKQLQNIALVLACQLLQQQQQQQEQETASSSFDAPHVKWNRLDAWTIRVDLTVTTTPNTLMKNSTQEQQQPQQQQQQQQSQENVLEIWIIADTYAVYSPKHWSDILWHDHILAAGADQSPTAWSDFDALFIGTMQQCDDNNNDSSASSSSSSLPSASFTRTMQTTMTNVTSTIAKANGNASSVWHPYDDDDDWDCAKHPPPLVADWRLLYPTGPILFLPATLSSLQGAGRQVYAQVRAYQQQEQKQDQEKQASTAAGAAQEAAVTTNSNNTTSSLPLLGVLPVRYHYQQMVNRCGVDCVNRGGGTLNRPCMGSWYDLAAWEMLDFIRYHTTAIQEQQRGKSITNVAMREESIRHWQVPVEPVVDFDSDDMADVDDSSSTIKTTPHLHWCTKPTISRPYDHLSPTIPVYYQCEGTMYNAFAHQLHNYVDDIRHRPDTPPAWGRRPWPIPPHRRILLFGNSHTRQVTESLMCMYQEHAVLESLQINAYSFQYTLRNNSTLVAIINSPIPYSSEWVQMIEDETGFAMNSFDAVVLGMLNECGNDDVFSKQMEKVSQTIPSVDCLHNAPPSITNWTQQYTAGPIIFMPMMSYKKRSVTKPLVKEIKALRSAAKAAGFRNRSVSYIDARRHVDAIGVECATFNRSGTSDCLNHMGPTHRCEGRLGGHPELVAWDLIERLYQVLSLLQ